MPQSVPRGEAEYLSTHSHPSLVERCSLVVHPLAAHIRAALSMVGQAPRTLENPYLERQREARPEGGAVIALGTTQHKYT